LKTPTIARVGMRCMITIDNGNEHDGTITQMFDDACVVRLDEPRDTSEGDAAAVAVSEWADVHLIEVRPDPAQVTSGVTATAPVKCIVRPGMRVEIPTGDGNDDRAGTVIAALPDCVVVKLDVQMEYGGSWHCAVDWNLVKMLDLAPAIVEGGNHHE
jgi:hypothetical protein